MAFENIEKNNLDEVKDDAYYQPNLIKLQPRSREGFYKNLAKVSVNIRDNVALNSLTSIKENEKEKEISVGETTNSLLHFNISDQIIFDEGKPINLLDKMTNIVFKKHDKYVEEEKELKGITSPVEEIEEPDIEYDEKPINSIELEEEKEDTMELPFTIIEKSEDLVIPEVEKEEKIDFSSLEDSSAYDEKINAELPSSPLEMEDSLDDLSQTVTRFVDLVNVETQANNELSEAKEKLVNANTELNGLKEQENEEIIKKYQLERAVIEETNRQKEILKRQTEVVNTKIFELNKEKANTDIEQEQIQSQIQTTNSNIEGIKQENDNLLDIINAIRNSYNDTEMDEEKSLGRVA